MADNSGDLNQDESQKPSEVEGDKKPDVMDKLWDQVTYHYVSYAQLVASRGDFRILFGERLPPSGGIRPTIGVVMTHEEARAILKALETQLARLDEQFNKKAEQSKEEV